MTLLELVTDLLKTGMKPNTIVCVESKKNVPFHIQRVEEDANNTGTITIYPSSLPLEEWEVGYR